MNYCGNEGKVIGCLSVGRSRAWGKRETEKAQRRDYNLQGTRYCITGSPTLPSEGAGGKQGAVSKMWHFHGAVRGSLLVGVRLDVFARAGRRAEQPQLAGGEMWCSEPLLPGRNWKCPLWFQACSKQACSSRTTLSHPLSHHFPRASAVPKCLTLALAGDFHNCILTRFLLGQSAALGGASRSSGFPCHYCVPDVFQALKPSPAFAVSTPPSSVFECWVFTFVFIGRPLSRPADSPGCRLGWAGGFCRKTAPGCEQK